MQGCIDCSHLSHNYGKANNLKTLLMLSVKCRMKKTEVLFVIYAAFILKTGHFPVLLS